MIPEIAERADALRLLCEKHGVRRLDLFGSAAAGPFDPDESDLDFLVEFDPISPGSYADAYFGLLEGLEGLEELFGRPVDLVVDTAIRNPYFRRAVEQTRSPLYAA